MVYAGSTFLLTCTIELSYGVNTEVVVTATWQRDGQQLNTSSDNLIVLETKPAGELTYETHVRFSPLSREIDDGEYTCEAEVTPGVPSMFILPSMPAMDSVSISATGTW